MMLDSSHVVRRLRQRGSALLVSMMVIVGLSLLGLVYVAASETENSISVNNRNYAQTQAVSEAAAKVIVEWYQKPDWAEGEGIMPLRTHADANAIKIDRFIDTNADGTPDNIGKYKTGGAYARFCCDKPFKPARIDRLFGTENSPDMLINATTSSSFLAAFNTRLFPGSDVQVTEIRVYAPPIVEGTVNANGFVEGGTRYGLATIRVTAQKLAPGTTRVISQRITKVVISEWPFPGPQGPVQSNANIATGGNVVVHWGKMTSQGTMFIKRDLIGLPWLHASKRVYFEQGYDSARAWPGAASAVPVGKVVYPSNAATAKLWSFVATTAGTTGGAEPAWNTTALGAATADGTAIWAARNAARYQVNNVDAPYYQYEWMWELLEKDFDDPWVQARARGAIINGAVSACCSTIAQPFRYSDPTQDELSTDSGSGYIGLSNWFHLQDTTNQSLNKEEVVFPRIDYRFWKQMALAAKGQDGVYYLKWVSGDQFTDGRQTKTFKDWTNTYTGAKPGFYFFDTKNGQNPQVPGGDAYLTPEVKISSGGGNTWTMSGFIYLNSLEFGTSGIRGVDTWVNFPGEPFRDIGFWEGAFISGAYRLKKNVAATEYVEAPDTRDNGKWDYQDLNGNGKFDLFVASKTLALPGGGSLSTWLPINFYDGCTPGDNGVAGANCSEPHEPYLNLVYPDDACCSGASYPNPIRAAWEAPGSQTRRPTKKKPDDSMPSTASGACNVAADFDEYCSSNKYNRDGEFDLWAGSSDSPVLNGVFYTQGDFRSTGNARYFGSVLINGVVDSTGTNEVWFDERLIKNEWPPKAWPFPRALITSISTDQ